MQMAAVDHDLAGTRDRCDRRPIDGHVVSARTAAGPGLAGNAELRTGRCQQLECLCEAGGGEGGFAHLAAEGRIGTIADDALLDGTVDGDW